MSSQPHTVLLWTVRRTRLPLLSLPCADCESGTATTGEGRFRVNGGGKLMGVWLFIRCTLCDRVSRLPVHERVPVGSIDPATLDGYRSNDPELVAATLLDLKFIRRNRIALDWTGAWRLDATPVRLDEPWPVQVEVTFEDPVPLRPDRLIAQGLGLSRNEASRRIKCGVPPRRPTTTGFTFTVLPDEE